MTGAGTTAVAEFFDDDLAPLVRRMADRPTDGGVTNDDDRRETRAMMWTGLVELGALNSPNAAELAEILGSVLYQGPLLDTLTARELSSAELVGDEPVALAVEAQPWACDDATITARRAFVGFAAEVSHFIVGGIDTGGLRLGLVRADHPSVAMRRHEDTGRGEAYHVEFTRTPVVATIGGQLEWDAALTGRRVRQAAYLVGLSQAALDHAVTHAGTRRQFGQPIGRSQSLAFRLSEMSMHIDATRLLVHDRDAPENAAANLAAAADLARTVATQTMQIHGADGMLSANDAQLYYRRAAVESVRLGTPAQLRSDVQQ